MGQGNLARSLMRRWLLLGCLVGLGLGSFCPAALGAVYADFNGDGRSDLAVGVPNENVGTVSDAGAVNVLYGGAAGVSSTGNQFWSQDSAGIQGVAQAANRLGRSLAAGDFDGDGRADLAIGVPGEDFGGSGTDTGAINVLYGGPGGLSSSGNQFWHQGTADAGAVNVLYGSGTGGVTATGNQFWHQNSSGVLDTAEANDNFGSSLAGGDFNGNGRSDLAVGGPLEEVGTTSDAGAVNVLYGSGTGGLTATGNQFWRQGGVGVLDTAEAGDNFGFSVGTGDFNANLRSDLAVGVPRENVGAISDAGAVNVLYGSGTRGRAGA